ncbi:MAG: rod shape-determining protein MreD [Verrucomicrobiales bacterium]|jgi:rod shape-determining protein MreD
MKRLKTFAVLVVLLALQVSIFAHLRPFGVSPDLLMVAALVGGIVGGGDYGARNGFAAGLLLDLVVPGPFGLAAGVYATFGYTTGIFAQSVDSEDPRVLPTLMGLAGFLATVVYGLALGVLGSEQFVEWRLVWVAIAVSFWAVVFTLPVRAAYGWAVTDARSAPRTDATRSVVN